MRGKALKVLMEQRSTAGMQSDHQNSKQAALSDDDCGRDFRIYCHGQAQGFPQPSVTFTNLVQHPRLILKADRAF